MYNDTVTQKGERRVKMCRTAQSDDTLEQHAEQHSQTTNIMTTC